MSAALASFLLGFPALFSIVNPVSGAFIFRTRTQDRSHAERVQLARRVGLYAALVMLVALWAGSYVLGFFGITLPALRCAGKTEQVDAAAGQDDVAFFPLTLPFTTGPGTISVAVALGSAHPASGIALLPFFTGMSAAAIAVAALVWALYSASDQISRLLGHVAGRAVSRLSAFFQLCIGVQILVTGVTEILQPLLPR